MGETKNLHVYDFGIFGRVLEPQNLRFFVRHQDTYKHQKTKQETALVIFLQIVFVANLKMLKIQNFENAEETGADKSPRCV